MTWLKRNWKILANWAPVVGMLLVAVLLSCSSGPRPIVEPTPDAPVARHMGWVNSPADVQVAVAALAVSQDRPTEFAAYREAIGADTDDAVFFWDAEGKVLKKVLDSWDQSSIGSCVSHGWGRALQDLLLAQIANGSAEEWPGAQVCREAIYGGSRHQIGQDKLGRGDGSVGAWAAQWAQQYGVIFYNKYDSVDLSGGGSADSTRQAYTVARCRQWGQSGCPKALEPTCKLHPIQTAGMVKTSAEVWTAVGNAYPVPICSDVGFDSPLEQGFCARRSSWGHCMTIRGRFVDDSPQQRGKCFVIQNSWGDYLKSNGSNNVITAKGRGPVTLPTGSFAVPATDVDAIVSQGDSFAISGFKGFPRQKIDWPDFACRPQIIRPVPRFEKMFALAP